MQGIWLILDSVIAVLALVLGFILHKWISDRKVGDAGSRAERLIQDAEREEQRRKLESIASLTAEEAKRQLLAQMEVESRREAQLIGMRLEEEARETAQVKAKEVLATTIQRLAPDYTVETAVSVVDLPS